MNMAANRSIGLAMLVLVAGILVLGNQPATSGNIEDDCDVYVGPITIPPSKECCADVKRADFPYLCKYVLPPPTVGQIFSMDKLIYVFRTCGFDIPPGTNCGGYIVPPATSPSSPPPPPPKA